MSIVTFPPNTGIPSGGITNTDVATAAAINAAKIANASVSDAEFQRLDGVTADIQTQIDTANAQITARSAWFTNLSIVRATTTNAGDSVKITSADGTALSASNTATILLPSTVTAGLLTRFTMTADVTILLTGAPWANGGKGDLTGAILRILAINDNATLKWGVALLSGRNILLTTDTTATQASVTTAEAILCNSAVASASNSCREIGFFRADFDDTGGAAEDLWAIQTGKGDIVTGQSGDGLWQPWNPTFPLGFSAAPTVTTARWMQIGREGYLQFITNASGTSNASTFTQTAPFKAARVQGNLSGAGADSGVALTGPAFILTTIDSATLSMYGNIASAGWTNILGKKLDFAINFEIGPVASFIE